VESGEVLEGFEDPSLGLGRVAGRFPLFTLAQYENREPEKLKRQPAGNIREVGHRRKRNERTER